MPSREQKVKTRCTLCGSVNNLVNHHSSYLDEDTVTVCRGCHLRLSKQKMPTRGFAVCKIYPTSNMAYIPQFVRKELGNIVEICTGPESALLFSYNTPLEDVQRSLQIILEDIKFRKEVETAKKKEATKLQSPAELGWALP